jgi:hypothetical protein
MTHTTHGFVVSAFIAPAIFATLARSPSENFKAKQFAFVKPTPAD